MGGGKVIGGSCRRVAQPVVASLSMGAGVVAMPAEAVAESSGAWPLGASTAFRWPDSGGDFAVDVDDLLSSLNFVFVGSLEARKGRWGVFTDVVYLDGGDRRSATRDLSFGGGARLLDVEETLDDALSAGIGPIGRPDRSGRRTASVCHGDGIVGARGRFVVGQGACFVPWDVHAGTGESVLTWQAMAGADYRLGWDELVLAWRHLDHDLGHAIDRLIFGGPALTATVRW